MIRIVEQVATRGAPAVRRRWFPRCTMVIGVDVRCGKRVKVRIYHPSTGGRSEEILGWCPEHAEWFVSRGDGLVIP